MPSLTTRNVRVTVEAHYSPSHSNPAKGMWFFVYEIEITNLGEETVQLQSRHWRILDAHGKLEEVRGPGVVGEKPVLAPGQSFRYNSGCPLRTPFGSMQGTYQMTTDDDDRFDVVVPPFALRDPRNLQ